MFRQEFKPYAIFDPITDLKIKVYKLCGVTLGDKTLKKALSLDMTPEEVADEVISLRQLLLHNNMLYKFNEFIK